MKRFVIYVVATLISFTALTSRADVPSDELLQALILIESSDNDMAVGDKHLQQKAYGCLGIRQPCVDDYNRWNKTSFSAEECLGNRSLSVMICRDYIDHYATAKRLGRVPTDEDKARIWNGGPNGWRKSSTEKYWKKVQAALE